MFRAHLSEEGILILAISEPTIMGVLVLILAGMSLYQFFRRSSSSHSMRENTSLSILPPPKAEHFVSQREKRFAHYRLLETNAMICADLRSKNNEKFTRFRELILEKYHSNKGLHADKAAELYRDVEGEIGYTRSINQQFIDDIYNTNARTYDTIIRLIEDHHAEQWTFDRHLCRENDRDVNSPCNSTIAQIESLHVEVAKRTDWIHADIKEWSVRRCYGILKEADRWSEQTTPKDSTLYREYCQ